MATISSAGIGSGLDVSSLVSQLVAAERAPTANRLSTAQSKLNVQLSALGSFKGTLSGLQGKLSALMSGGSLGSVAATSSNEDVFTVTASDSASIGNYDIEVVSLAKASKQISGVYVDGADTVLGNGDVTIGVGADSFTVSLGDGANTLADLRNAINDAADNTGVTATLINESGGTRLLLTAKDTGVDHTVSVSSSLLGFTEKQAPQDAHLRVEGYDVYSASNTVTDAIDGVSITLLAEDPGNTASLKVSADTAAASDAIQSFVKSYNDTLTVIKALTKYDPDTGTAGSLNGDSTVRGAASQMRNIIGSIVSDAGSFSHLSQLGISIQTDGTLEVDDSKLSAALTTDRAAVERLFGGDNGIATRLDTALEGLIGDDGIIESRTESINSRLEDISDQTDALDRRMESVQARYLAQFTALDTLISQLTTTSDYLSQQLDSIAALRNSTK
jgi:flagellar hook-associated protein 2